MTSPTGERSLWCAEFLDSLDPKEFPLGVEHYLRAERLFDRVGPVSTAKDFDDLKVMLGAIVVTSADKQQTFYARFDEHFGSGLPDDSNGSIAVTRPSGSAAVLSALRATGPGIRGNWKIASFAAAAMLVLSVLPMTLRQGPEPTGTPAVGRKTKAPSPSGPLVNPLPAVPTPAAITPARILPFEKPAPPDPSWYAMHARQVRLFVVLGIALLTIVYELIRHARRRAIAESERRRSPPFGLQIDAPSVDPPQAVNELHATARVAHRRQRSNVVQFSATRSVAATIEGLGFPALVYTTGTRPPDYLVLVERQSPWDHQASLFDALADRLSDEGLHLVRYHYERDPRVSFEDIPGSDERESFKIAELKRRHPDARLLIFGTGGEFLHPVTGRPADWLSALRDWDDRALFTSVPVRDWGLREANLARELLVLPATLAGLRAATEHFDSATRPRLRDWIDRANEQTPFFPDDRSQPADIESYLGGKDAYRWLLACAVYPELRWSLTLTIRTLPSFANAAFDENTILRMVRLPWFRRGAFPTELRLRLLDELARVDRESKTSTEWEVRKALVRLLEEQRVEVESVASETRARELLLNKLYLYRDDRSMVRRLTRELRRIVPRQELATDVTVVRLLGGLAVPRLAMVMPDRIRRLLYFDGQAHLGTRWTMAGVVAIAGMTVGWFGTPIPDQTIATSVDIEPAAVVAPAGSLVRFRTRVELRRRNPRGFPVLQSTLSGVFGSPRTAIADSGSSLVKLDEVTLERSSGWYAGGVETLKDSVQFVVSDTELNRWYALAPPILADDSNGVRIPDSILALLDSAVSIRSSPIGVGMPVEVARPGSCDARYAVVDNGNVVRPRANEGWSAVRITKGNGTLIIPVYASLYRLSAAESALVRPFAGLPPGGLDRLMVLKRSLPEAGPVQLEVLRDPRDTTPAQSDSVTSFVNRNPIDACNIRGLAYKRQVTFFQLVRAPVPVVPIVTAITPRTLRVPVGDTGRVVFFPSGVSSAFGTWRIDPPRIATITPEGLVQGRSGGAGFVFGSTASGRDSIPLVVPSDSLAPSYVGLMVALDDSSVIGTRLRLTRRGGGAYDALLELGVVVPGGLGSRGALGIVDTSRLDARFAWRNDSLIIRPGRGMTEQFVLRLRASAARDSLVGYAAADTVGRVPAMTIRLATGTTMPSTSYCKGFSLVTRRLAFPLGDFGVVRTKNPKDQRAIHIVIPDSAGLQAAGDTLRASRPGVYILAIQCATSTDSLVVSVTAPSKQADTAPAGNAGGNYPVTKSQSMQYDSTVIHRFVLAAAAKLGRSESFVDSLVPPMLSGRLTGVDVVKRLSLLGANTRSSTSTVSLLSMIFGCSDPKMITDSEIKNLMSAKSIDMLIDGVARAPSIVKNWDRCVGGRRPTAASAKH